MITKAFIENVLGFFFCLFVFNVIEVKQLPVILCAWICVTVTLQTWHFTTVLAVCLDRTCHTTRGPYFGEENGIDYHFVSEEEFQNMTHMVR